MKHSAHTHLLVVTVATALLLAATGAVNAFHFTVVPGTLKCFTNTITEEGRYELRYRMAKTLAPYVSVAVTASSGRVLLEHEVASHKAREIISMTHADTIAVCFNVAAKAELATSPNVTLTIVDAEDAELTRMKKQSYSSSSPIALGAAKGSGALRQMLYIDDMTFEIRRSMNAVIASDTAIISSLNSTRQWMWKMLGVLLAVASVVIVVNYFRLRRFMLKNAMLETTPFLQRRAKR